MVAAVLSTRVAKLPKRALHFPMDTFDRFPSGSFLAFLVPKCKYTWCRGQQHQDGIMPMKTMQASGMSSSRQKIRPGKLYRALES